MKLRSATIGEKGNRKNQRVNHRMMRPRLGVGHSRVEYDESIDAITTPQKKSVG